MFISVFIYIFSLVTVKCLLACYKDYTYVWCSCMLSHLQSCPTLYDPMDCSTAGSSVYGDSPGKNTGVGCHDFLLSDPGIKPASLTSPELAGGFFTTNATWEAHRYAYIHIKMKIVTMLYFVVVQSLSRVQLFVTP